jgi:hypothetical protein
VLSSDRRSFVQLAARYPHDPARAFFVAMAGGEGEALGRLASFSAALDLTAADVAAYEPRPGCQSYPAFVAWLALNGTRLDVTLAFLVNLDAWGANCARMRQALEHPFVRGIADGTLDPDRFRHFLRQDYLFLIEYARVLALACARAPRLDLMERFAELTQATLTDEMDLHRACAAEWGVKPDELERESATATTRSYSDFLIRTASMGDYDELLACLLPCMWGYSELGRALEPRNATTIPSAPGSRPTRATSSGSWPAGVARRWTQSPTPPI